MSSEMSRRSFFGVGAAAVAAAGKDLIGIKSLCIPKLVPQHGVNVVFLKVLVDERAQIGPLILVRLGGAVIHLPLIVDDHDLRVEILLVNLTDEVAVDLLARKAYGA